MSNSNSCVFSSDVYPCPQALIAALCCLMISGTQAANSFVLNDQLGAESASRLYRQAGGLVYASAAPYGAYSFQIPAISTPQGSASRIIPVQESLSRQHASGNGYLKDSYGNRFVEALQSMKSLPFKPFPQQYVQLQELPAHFAQPLSAAAPAHRQLPAAAPAHQQHQHWPPPQVVVGSHYRLPLQSAAPTPLNQHVSFAHPGVYADSIKHFSPASISYGPHYGSVVHLPVQSAAPTRGSQKSAPLTADSSHSLSEHQEHRSAPQHSSGHRAVHIDTQPQERYHHLPGEHKFQRLQEAPPQETYTEEEAPAPARQVKHKATTQQLVSAVKDTPISTVVNGKKTVVNVETKPPLPLLDINLLEPLTFANPLVPQVQHFLPRISEATYYKLPELDKHEDKKYQKEFVIQKTKTYDSGVIKGKPKKTKTKHKSPRVEPTYDDDYIPAATARPQVTVTKALEDAPEIVYEINSPNYKETIKEKVVNYNKETNSEPVHYTYGTKTHKEPVQYSYTHSSKEPVHIKEVRYESKGGSPKHLIYNSNPEEHNGENEKSKTESEDSGESDEQSENETPQLSHHRQHDHSTPKGHYIPEQEYHHRPSSDSHHNEHRSDHHRPNSDSHHNVQHSDHHRPSSNAGQHSGHKHHNKPSSDGHHVHHEYHHKPSSGAHHNLQHKDQEYHRKPHPDTQRNVQHSSNPVEYESVDVIPFQYEEDIRLTAPIKVDPNQHVQRGHSEPPQHNSRPVHSPQHHAQSDSKPHHDHDTPSTHIREKTKQVYIKEETPEEDYTVGEQLMKAMFGKEEDKEQNFENAYKNAAFGFPAYDQSGADADKDIYNPESYGAPREHSAYDIDHAPFQQYQEQGDKFPKEVRLSYKDDRDKMKEDYFLDYSISKPESMADRYQNKANYYKLYKDQRPEKYVALEDDKNKQKSAKLTAIPYSYYPVHGGNMQQFFAQYKAAPYVAEYDYSKGVLAKPKDNSAHASRPLQRYKMTTHFVEPQFQYGFEPISIPLLLDSELAAMATNNSPESEKPGTRKKIYQENFYIKKTSRSDAGPNS